MRAGKNPQSQPVRRHRPADRNEQIVAAAARLFHESGYDRVRVADIATAVGVTIPAIYRHHPSKQALLERAIESALEQVDEAFAQPQDPPEEALRRTLAAISYHALVRRDLWSLLQRELRHLPDERRAILTAQYSLIVESLAGYVGRARVELSVSDARLITHATLAALGSASQHQPILGERRAQQVLESVAFTIAAVTLPVSRPVIRTSQPFAALVLGDSRREQILTAAVRLFRQRGYQAVTTDEIGNSAGMAGPSVYHYFASKAEILTAAISRFTEWLNRGRARAVGSAHSPHEALDQLLRDYIEIGLGNSDLLGVYLTEQNHLPPEQKRRMADAFAEHVASYRTFLALARNDIRPEEADVLTYAALAIVNDLVRRASLREQPQLADQLARLTTAVLFAPLPSTN